MVGVDAGSADELLWPITALGCAAGATGGDGSGIADSDVAEASTPSGLGGALGGYGDLGPWLSAVSLEYLENFDIRTDIV